MSPDHAAPLGLHVWTGPALGWGVVGAVDGPRLRVDFFESAAKPVVESRWFHGGEVWVLGLPRHTRVFWEEDGRWYAGRVATGNPTSGYAVCTPNPPYGERIDARRLRVRWSRSVIDPLEVLLLGAHEVPDYADARMPFIRALVAQRAACFSTPAILSSAVELYPHQLRAVLQVLRDPIQRYLLADEVGLGKTIEAGMIARQILLDKPTAAVTFIVPDALRRQWQNELRQKFFIDDFHAAQIHIASQEDPLRWQGGRTADLVVIDEAHHLVSAETPASVRELLAEVCHASPRLLLLSATPALHHEGAMLGMLHLLDPLIYRLGDIDGFTARVRARHEIAKAFYALDPGFPELVPLYLAQIRSAFPADQRLVLLADAADDAARSTPDTLPTHLEQLRAYVNETYRLHRRVIRHRRGRVLAAPGCGPASPTFEVRGRQEPERLDADDPRGDAAEQVLEQWRQAVRDHLVECDATEEAWSAYAAAHAVLVERSRDMAGAMLAAVAFRLGDGGGHAGAAGLDRQEARLLQSCPVLDADRELLRGLEKLPGYEESLPEIRRLVGAVCRRHHRVLVFTGTTALARAVIDVLRAGRSAHPVVGHLAGDNSARVEQAVRAWVDGYVRVLVCDRSGEEGRNFQAADAVVHLHLPWSVNRFEQRLGRVDRYGDGGPAAQYVLAPTAEESVCGAWLALLRDGFGVFRASLSMLQYAVDEVTPTLSVALLRHGGQGLLEAADDVEATLRQRRKEIETEDTLEATFTGEYNRDALFKRIDEVESHWQVIERGVDNLVCGAKGSLQLVRKSETEDPAIRRYLPGKRALLPFHLLRQALPGSWDTPGCFNRAAALRRPGRRVLRVGAPFVDTLWRWLQQDDRGQASAWWRWARGADGDQVYLGFEYIVDADIGIVRDGFPRSSLAALQRRLDGWFVPFAARFWLDPWTADLAEPGQQQMLEQAYDPGRGDANLDASRFPVLLGLFGGAHAFRDVVERSRRAALAQLGALCRLEARSTAAEAAAIRDLGREEEQRRVRALTGARSTGETGSMAAAMAEAFRRACRAPRIRLMTVSCVVLSDRPFARAAEEYGVDTR